MNIPKEIIDKARQAGYRRSGRELDVRDRAIGYCPFEVLVLDPSFWQSLEKALGWKSPAYFRSKDYQVEPWLFYMLSFVECVASESPEDTDAFWKELLTS